MKFTDIHTHILPGIDDGARDLTESLALLAAAASQGADQIIVTPHYYVDAPTDPDELREKLTLIRKELDKNGTGADADSPALYLGNEVLYFDGMTERLDRGEILTLNGTDRVLVEFYPSESFDTVLRAVRHIYGAGYIPVIAHAERYLCLRGDAHEGLSPLIENGAEIQLGSDAVCHGLMDGLFNKDAAWCRKQIEAGLVSYLGSDMHRMKTRPPEIARCAAWCRKTLSPQTADALLWQNAAANLDCRAAAEQG